MATRPIKNNGFGWTPRKADLEISRLEFFLTLLPDSQAIYLEWRKVVLLGGVLGKQVHDARIVAAMNTHQITKLLTFNTKDFKRFKHITLIDPNIL